ncbi:MAG: extracellular solute-binding protein [Chloroflexi bacterium]|nr:extracellular solute-binding protein [Chloroflexota bacterium]
MIGKMIRNVSLMGATLSLVILLSCAQAVPATTKETGPTGAAGQITVQQQGWEQDWQHTLAAARQEGNLSIYTAVASGELRVQVGKWFKDKFGLDIDWTPIPAAQVGPKVFRERQAGIYLGDIQMGALSRQIGELKPAGALDPIKPLLVLPEVLDKTVWFGGDIAWVDNEKIYTLNALLAPEYRLAINTNQVKPGEIKGYKDLLDPRWKEKIILIHPVFNTRPIAIMVTFLGPDFLRKLGEQRPVITDNHRLAIEWLSQGKYPVYVFSQITEVTDFIRAGAPVAQVIPEEGGTLGGATMAISLFNRQPHPNAAKVFLNWWLSKELGVSLSRFVGAQSARLDVPTDHLPPADVRDPKLKFVIADTENFQIEQAKLRDLTQEVFGALMK